MVVVVVAHDGGNVNSESLENRLREKNHFIHYTKLDKDEMNIYKNSLLNKL